MKAFKRLSFCKNLFLCVYLVSLFCKIAVKIQVTKSEILPRRGRISLFVTCIFTAVLQQIETSHRFKNEFLQKLRPVNVFTKKRLKYFTLGMKILK